MFNFVLGAGGTNSVVPFHSRPKAAPTPRGWGQDEIAEAYRVIDLLARGGLAVHLVSGLSDEGDPWAAVLRDDNEDVVVHFARIDGRVILVSATSERVFTGKSLAAALRSVLETQPLILPAGGGRLFLHPATILAAFIATALVNAATDASAAAAVDGARDAPARAVHEAVAAGVRQGDGGYTPALVAAAIASVATAFTLTMEETRLFDENTSLELSQADLKPAASTERHLIFDQMAWGDALGAAFGAVHEPNAAALQAEAHSPAAAPGAQIDASALLDALAYLKSLGDRADGALALDAAASRLASAAEQQSGAIDLSRFTVVEPAHAFAVVPSGAAEAAASLDAPAGEGKGAGPALPGHPGFVLAGGENFYWEARFLLGMASPTDSAPRVVTMAEAGASAGPQLPNETPSRTISSDAAVLTVSRDVAADVRASILKGFTQDATKELPADAELMGQVIASLKALPFLPEVDRVVLFEADDVSTDIFMMFKGVAMLRGDLLGQELHELAPQQQVAFEMTNGETFRLLGVIDV